MKLSESLIKYSTIANNCTVSIMSKKKLLSTAEVTVSKSNVHCLVITMSGDKTHLEGVGDDTWVKALKEEPGLLNKMNEVLLRASRDVVPGTPLRPEHFPEKLGKLFACPGSKQWKGVKIRNQLSKYLTFFGFGKNMSKRYGEDDPPTGWPVLVDWEGFKGPSKSCSLGLCTEIIKQLLEAQDLDPMDHFIREDENEDHGDDEPPPAVEDHQREEPVVVEPVPGKSNKRKRSGKQKPTTVVETIARIQEQEDLENAVLANQREVQARLNALLEDGELSDSN